MRCWGLWCLGCWFNWLFLVFNLLQICLWVWFCLFDLARTKVTGGFELIREHDIALTAHVVRYFSGEFLTTFILKVSSTDARSAEPRRLYTSHGSLWSSIPIAITSLWTQRMHSIKCRDGKHWRGSRSTSPSSFPSWVKFMVMTRMAGFSGTNAWRRELLPASHP